MSTFVAKMALIMCVLAMQRWRDELFYWGLAQLFRRPI